MIPWKSRIYPGIHRDSFVAMLTSSALVGVTAVAGGFVYALAIILIPFIWANFAFTVGLGCRHDAGATGIVEFPLSKIVY